jgi:hypothetical protein
MECGASAQSLRHSQKVTGNFGGDTCGEGRRAGLSVAHPFVDRKQFGPQVDGEHVHEFAAGLTCTPFGVADECAPNTLALLTGIDGEQAQIGPFAAEFKVEASGKLTGGFCEQKCPGMKHRLALVEAGSITVNEKAFDAESEVYQCHDLLRVRWVSCADGHVAMIVHEAGPRRGVRLSGRPVEYSQRGGANPILCLQMAGESE